MKRLFLGSVFLTFFAISIALFQASCQKEAIANTESTYTLPAATTSTLGGVIVGSGLDVSTSGTLSVSTNVANQQNKIIYAKRVNSIREVWTANYDGSDQKKLNIGLPTGSDVWEMRISPDGQNLIFSVFAPHSSESHIYTCKTDGSSLKKIIDGTGLGIEGLNIFVAY